MIISISMYNIISGTLGKYEHIAAISIIHPDRLLHKNCFLYTYYVHRQLGGVELEGGLLCFLYIFF